MYEEWHSHHAPRLPGFLQGVTAWRSTANQTHKKPSNAALPRKMQIISPGNLWHVQTRTLRYAFGKNLEKYAQILRPKDPGRSTVGKSEKTLKKRNILKQLSQIVPVSWVWYPFSPLHSTMRKQGPPRAATMNHHFQTGNNYCWFKLPLLDLLWIITS